jgi:hypothetical protein
MRLASFHVARPLAIFRALWIQSMSSLSILLTSILVLFSHLRLGLLAGFPTWLFYALLTFPVVPNAPPYGRGDSPFIWSPIKIWIKVGYGLYSVPPPTVFSILLPPHSRWYIFLKRPYTLLFLEIKLPRFTAIQRHNSVCLKSWGC